MRVGVLLHRTMIFVGLFLMVLVVHILGLHLWERLFGDIGILGGEPRTGMMSLVLGVVFGMGVWLVRKGDRHGQAHEAGQQSFVWGTDDRGQLTQGTVSLEAGAWQEWLRVWRAGEGSESSILMPPVVSRGQTFQGCVMKMFSQRWCWVAWPAFAVLRAGLGCFPLDDQMRFWRAWSHSVPLPILMVQKMVDKYVPVSLNRWAQEWLRYEELSFLEHHFASIAPELHRGEWQDRVVTFTLAGGVQEQVMVVHTMPLSYGMKDGLPPVLMLFLLPLKTPLMARFFQEKVLREIPWALAWVDAYGQTCQENQTWHDVFGAWLGETSLQKIFALGPHKNSFPVADGLGKLSHFPSKIQITLGDKKLRLLFEAGRFLDEEGMWIQALDTTQLLVHEEDAQDKIQTQKLQILGKLASNVAHDFNNILTAILGFCDLILQKSSQGDGVFMDVTQIKQSALRASNLARQLIMFARDDVPEKKSLYVQDVLTDMSALLRRLVGGKIDVVLKLDNAPCYILGDISQLEQILLNLTVNARDAILPSSGQVTISVHKTHEYHTIPCIEKKVCPGDYVRLKIEDTGTGIAAEHMPNVFKRFFSTKDPGKGTGLGLATCWDLMEQWGGGIQLDSHWGKGTSVHLWFPEYKGEHGTSETLPSYRPHGLKRSQQRILLVEDEDPVRLFATRSLRGHGYIVDEAREGKRALELLQQNEYSLLITDVIMPGTMDGLKLAEQGRKHRAHLKLLFVSGYAQEHVFQGAPDPWKASFLQKPFSLNDLLNMVSHILEESPEGDVPGGDTDRKNLL